MGAGGSKKSKSLPPARHSVPSEPAHPSLAPPTFAPHPDLYPALNTNMYSVEAPHSLAHPTRPASTLPPHLEHASSLTLPRPRDKDEDAPSILIDENTPIPRLPSDPRPESGTGVYILDGDTLNGVWSYFPGDYEIEMETAMSLCIERAYVRGLPVATFRFEGNPCTVSFGDSSFTVQGASGVAVYPTSRKAKGREKLFWQADDQVMRPFLPAVEELILTHKDVDVVFQMDNDVLSVNFAAGILKEPATGAEHLLQLLDSST